MTQTHDSFDDQGSDAVSYGQILFCPVELSCTCSIRDTCIHYKWLCLFLPLWEWVWPHKTKSDAVMTLYGNSKLDVMNTVNKVINKEDTGSFDLPDSL